MDVTEVINKKYSGRSEKELLDVIAKLTVENNRLALFLYGSRKERYTPDPEGTRLLFNEAEEILETAAPEEDEAQNEKPGSDGKKKNRGKRKPLPDHLPRVQKTKNPALFIRSTWSRLARKAVKSWKLNQPRSMSSKILSFGTNALVVRI
jgi:hypothetical protein